MQKRNNVFVKSRCKLKLLRDNKTLPSKSKKFSDVKKNWTLQFADQQRQKNSGNSCYLSNLTGLTLLVSCSLEKIAEANRNRVILEAEAEAEALKIKGEAEGMATAYDLDLCDLLLFSDSVL